MIQLHLVIFMKKQIKGTAALLVATIIWGSAFIAQSVGNELIGPFTFQTVRCLMAIAFLIPTIFFFDLGKKDGKTYLSRWMDKRLWISGAICGTALFIPAGLQQVGLVYTSASKAGFITAMYIVLVPFLGLFLKQKPPFTAWISVAIAVAGLYLLSCVGVSEINIGDLLLMGCALTYSIQITLIDRLAPGQDGIRLNCIQLIFCALWTAPFMLSEQPVLANIIACAGPLAYAGVMSMGVAYTLQIIGQQNLPPTPASLLMSLESVFAALCGWLILHEQLTATELFGCAMVFAAVIISQLPVKEKKHAKA